MEHAKKDLTPPAHLSLVSSTPAIDEALRTTGLEQERLRLRAPGPLMGQVLDGASLDFPGRVLVRWSDEPGRVHERWLRVLRGLDLAPGDDVLLTRPSNRAGWIVTGALDRGDREHDARLPVDKGREELDTVVDGSRIELEGRDEVVLRCGKASITLRCDGRVLISGTDVSSVSEGTQRIMGATVHIN